MRIFTVVLLVGLVLWGLFVFPLAQQLMNYTSYNKTASIDSIEWSIQPIHDELWRPKANFQYTVDGKTYQMQEVFQSGRYRNPYAAKEAVKALEKEKKWVWYSSKNPALGTLEKFFPEKKVIYSIITLFLVIYTAFLASYVKGK